ncbi:MAG: hypothetical protein IIC67_04410 [Thaumarchaeota archaeon]|nr:hypothetical protein [Nitrososphaerota archaeon]
MDKKFILTDIEILTAQISLDRSKVIPNRTRIQIGKYNQMKKNLIKISKNFHS